MSLESERREYTFGALSRDELAASPYDQFSLWMDQALSAGIQDPTAMCLATVDASGQPWQRIVLLKGFSEDGLVFYTNLKSRKGLEIAANSQVSCHFPWLQMDRQVIVSGVAAALDPDTARPYFDQRPRESQLAALVSRQSRPVDSRAALEQMYQQAEQDYQDNDIPMPEDWGGYLVKPVEWEFWQGGRFRLHDRFSYRGEGSGWDIRRLAP